jgi:hypothetical protein
VQITHKLNPLLGNLTIIHPFHPQQGQNFAILSVKVVDGIRHYSLRTDSDVLCVAESWTDRQVGLKIDSASPKIPFDALTLKELAQFIRNLEGFRKNNSESC